MLELTEVQIGALKRFEQELQCTLCRRLLEEPSHTKCEHDFCKACINAWLDKSNLCPTCNLPVQPRDVKTNPSLKTVVLQFKMLQDYYGRILADMEQLKVFSRLPQDHPPRTCKGPDADEDHIDDYSGTLPGTLMGTCAGTLQMITTQELDAFELENLAHHVKPWNPLQNRDESTGNNENERIVLSSTMLTPPMVAQVKRICSTLRWTYVDRVEKEPRLTHLVYSATREGNNDREYTSFKYFHAMSLGSWILPTEWVVECNKANEKVPEAGFELVGSPHQVSRLRVISRSDGLFKGRLLYTCIFEDGQSFTKEELIDLCELNDAKVVDLSTLDMGDKSVVDQFLVEHGFSKEEKSNALQPPIILSSHATSKCNSGSGCPRCYKLGRLVRQSFSPVIDVAWVFNCLAQQTVVSIREYTFAYLNRSKELKTLKSKPDSRNE